MERRRQQISSGVEAKEGIKMSSVLQKVADLSGSDQVHLSSERTKQEELPSGIHSLSMSQKGSLSSGIAEEKLNFAPIQFSEVSRDWNGVQESEGRTKQMNEVSQVNESVAGNSNLCTENSVPVSSIDFSENNMISRSTETFQEPVIIYSATPDTMRKEKSDENNLTSNCAAELFQTSVAEDSSVLCITKEKQCDIKEAGSPSNRCDEVSNFQHPAAMDSFYPYVINAESLVFSDISSASNDEAQMMTHETFQEPVIIDSAAPDIVRKEKSDENNLTFNCSAELFQTSVAKDSSVLCITKEKQCDIKEAGSPSNRCDEVSNFQRLAMDSFYPYVINSDSLDFSDISSASNDEAEMSKASVTTDNAVSCDINKIPSETSLISNAAAETYAIMDSRMPCVIKTEVCDFGENDPTSNTVADIRHTSTLCMNETDFCYSTEMSLPSNCSEDEISEVALVMESSVPNEVCDISNADTNLTSYSTAETASLISDCAKVEISEASAVVCSFVVKREKFDFGSESSLTSYCASRTLIAEKSAAVELPFSHIIKTEPCDFPEDSCVSNFDAELGGLNSHSDAKGKVLTGKQSSVPHVIKKEICDLTETCSISDSATETSVVEDFSVPCIIKQECDFTEAVMTLGSTANAETVSVLNSVEAETEIFKTPVVKDLCFLYAIKKEICETHDNSSSVEAMNLSLSSSGESETSSLQTDCSTGGEACKSTIIKNVVSENSECSLTSNSTYEAKASDISVIKDSIIPAVIKNEICAGSSTVDLSDEVVETPVVLDSFLPLVMKKENCDIYENWSSGCSKSETSVIVDSTLSRVAGEETYSFSENQLISDYTEEAGTSEVSGITDLCVPYLPKEEGILNLNNTTDTEIMVSKLTLTHVGELEHEGQTFKATVSYSSGESDAEIEYMFSNLGIKEEPTEFYYSSDVSSETSDYGTLLKQNSAVVEQCSGLGDTHQDSEECAKHTISKAQHKQHDKYILKNACVKLERCDALIYKQHNKYLSDVHVNLERCDKYLNKTPLKGHRKSPNVSKAKSGVSAYKGCHGSKNGIGSSVNAARSSMMKNDVPVKQNPLSNTSFNSHVPIVQRSEKLKNGMLKSVHKTAPSSKKKAVNKKKDSKASSTSRKGKSSVRVKENVIGILNVTEEKYIGAIQSKCEIMDFDAVQEQVVSSEETANDNLTGAIQFSTLLLGQDSANCISSVPINVITAPINSMPIDLQASLGEKNYASTLFAPACFPMQSRKHFSQLLMGATPITSINAVDSLNLPVKNPPETRKFGECSAETCTLRDEGQPKQPGMLDLNIDISMYSDPHIDAGAPATNSQVKEIVLNLGNETSGSKQDVTDLCQKGKLGLGGKYFKHVKVQVPLLGKTKGGCEKHPGTKITPELVPSDSVNIVNQPDALEISLRPDSILANKSTESIAAIESNDTEQISQVRLMKKLCPKCQLQLNKKSKRNPKKLYPVCESSDLVKIQVPVHKKLKYDVEELSCNESIQDDSSTTDRDLLVTSDSDSAHLEPLWKGECSISCIYQEAISKLARKISKSMSTIKSRNKKKAKRKSRRKVKSQPSGKSYEEGKVLEPMHKKRKQDLKGNKSAESKNLFDSEQISRAKRKRHQKNELHQLCKSDKQIKMLVPEHISSDNVNSLSGDEHFTDGSASLPDTWINKYQLQNMSAKNVPIMESFSSKQASRVKHKKKQRHKRKAHSFDNKKVQIHKTPKCNPEKYFSTKIPSRYSSSDSGCILNKDITTGGDVMDCSASPWVSECNISEVAVSKPAVESNSSEIGCSASPWVSECNISEVDVSKPAVESNSSEIGSASPWVSEYNISEVAVSKPAVESNNSEIGCSASPMDNQECNISEVAVSKPAVESNSNGLDCSASPWINECNISEIAVTKPAVESNSSEIGYSAFPWLSECNISKVAVSKLTAESGSNEMDLSASPWVSECNISNVTVSKPAVESNNSEIGCSASPWVSEGNISEVAVSKPAAESNSNGMDCSASPWANECNISRVAVESNSNEIDCAASPWVSVCSISDVAVSKLTAESGSNEMDCSASPWVNECSISDVAVSKPSVESNSSVIDCSASPWVSGDDVSEIAVSKLVIEPTCNGKGSQLKHEEKLCQKLKHCSEDNNKKQLKIRIPDHKVSKCYPEKPSRIIKFTSNSASSKNTNNISRDSILSAVKQLLCESSGIFQGAFSEAASKMGKSIISEKTSSSGHDRMQDSLVTHQGMLWRYHNQCQVAQNWNQVNIPAPVSRVPVCQLEIPQYDNVKGASRDSDISSADSGICLTETCKYENYNFSDFQKPFSKFANKTESAASEKSSDIGHRRLSTKAKLREILHRTHKLHRMGKSSKRVKTVVSLSTASKCEHKKPCDNENASFSLEKPHMSKDNASMIYEKTVTELANKADESISTVLAGVCRQESRQHAQVPLKCEHGKPSSFLKTIPELTLSDASVDGASRRTAKDTSTCIAKPWLSEKDTLKLCHKALTKLLNTSVESSNSRQDNVCVSQVSMQIPMYNVPRYKPNTSTSFTKIPCKPAFRDNISNNNNCQHISEVACSSMEKYWVNDSDSSKTCLRASLDLPGNVQDKVMKAQKKMPVRNNGPKYQPDKTRHFAKIQPVHSFSDNTSHVNSNQRRANKGACDHAVMPQLCNSNILITCQRALLELVNTPVSSPEFLGKT